MRLSWNEIRLRAAAFAAKWAEASYEKGETQPFYEEFFRIFGVERRSVARYEEQVRRLDDRRGYMDLFWPGVLLVEQKSAGRSLEAAAEQADAYFDALPERDRPRYRLLSDFRTFDLYDRDERKRVSFPLADLPAHIERFGFILGVERRAFRDQDPVNIEAAELMGRLHDRLRDTGYTGEPLQHTLVRLLFCLFADDTGVFEPRDLLLDFLESRTREDGSDLGTSLAQLFQVLDTPPADRYSTLDEDLARFPYINGDLFRGTLPIPSFDSAMRGALLDACRFDWSKISPAIFGALFQSVMDPVERREQGAHYTTEQNILKVIEPLFLDDLRAEFGRIAARRDRGRRAALLAFRKRLGAMQFLDPACGCGNFLIIAYRELRALEIEVLRALRDAGGREALALDVATLSLVEVDQFHGIELGEFPARIAAAALWMMDHIMNNRLSLEFGQAFARIPLEKSPRIRCADALEIEWSSVLEPGRCSFVFGNPPFHGAKHQSPKQREQVRRIANLGGSGGTLDYVAAWFLRAGEYVAESSARIGFVATNSITQGEQAAQLWPLLFERYGLVISFAHRTFAWGSDARGKAHVHVVILGLDRKEAAPAKRRLFIYEHGGEEALEVAEPVISPYLFGAGRLSDPHVVVREANRPINGMPRVIIGSKPIDGGHYIFTAEERARFLASEPLAAPFFRPYPGGREFIRGLERWILVLHEIDPPLLRRLPRVRERVEAVRAFRLKSRSSQTRALAETPTLFHVNVLPEAPFLVLPEVSSERREYLPIGWLEPPVVPSNLVRILPNATLWHFALLTSTMHMSWLRSMGGRLESRYRYSIGLVYNTFPLPRTPGQGDETGYAELETPAQEILDARARHPGASLADLYDPDTMPPDLKKAHLRLDRAVDRLYRRAPFPSERERVEHLLERYARLSAPLTARRKKTRRR